MDNYLTQVINYLLTQSWQIAVLAVVIAAVSLMLKNKSAHVRYLLWLIVLAKCLVPPLFTVPLAVLPQEKLSEPVLAYPARIPAAFEAVDADVAEPPSPSSAPVATPPAPTVTEKPVRLTVRQWFDLAWIIGAAGFIIAAVTKTLRTEFWLRRQRKPLTAELQIAIEDLFSGLGLKSLPTVWLVDGIGQPFVWGLLRGSIYLPADFVKVNNAEHRRGVLGHELSHILRFDAAVNLLQIIAQAVFWFHPFVWWANKKIRAEREKCCDETAIARLNAKAKDYSTAIVNILVCEYKSTRPVPSLAIAGPVKNIEERIKTIMKPGKKFYKRPSLIAATIVMLIALATIPTAFVLTVRGQAQPATQSSDHSTLAGEKSEQARFAARTFNSEVAFDVWFREAGDYSERQIGRTPSATPVQIPACWLWGVQPLAPVNDLDLLIREINQNEVPGLILNAVDSNLKQLSVLTKLRLLNLRGSKITDAGLEYVKGMSLLEQLDLRGTSITDAGMEHLKDLTKLQMLYLTGTSITDAGLEHLKDMNSLQNLFLSNSLITDDGLEHLKGMTGLKLLSLGLPKITNDGLKHLKGLSGLESLYLGEWRTRSQQITESGLEHLKGMTGLKILVLWSTPITDVGLEHLKDMTSLQTLSFPRGSSITDKGLEHIKGLTNLQELLLVNMNITDAGLEQIKDLNDLYYLNLTNTKITDAGLEQIKGLNGLKQLYLAGTPITNAGLEHLKGMTILQELDLTGTSITDVGLEHFKDLTGLQRLNLNNTKVTDAGIQQLKQSLPKLRIAR